MREQMYAQLRAYLAHERSLDDLFRWLAGHVQEIASSDDAALRDLDAQVWLHIDDIDDGTETEGEFRAWLATELPTPA